MVQYKFIHNSEIINIQQVGMTSENTKTYNPK